MPPLLDFMCPILKTLYDILQSWGSLTKNKKTKNTFISLFHSLANISSLKAHHRKDCAQWILTNTTSNVHTEACGHGFWGLQKWEGEGLEEHSSLLELQHAFPVRLFADTLYHGTPSRSVLVPFSLYPLWDQFFYQYSSPGLIAIITNKYWAFKKCRCCVNWQVPSQPFHRATP